MMLDFHSLGTCRPLRRANDLLLLDRQTLYLVALTERLMSTQLFIFSRGKEKIKLFFHLLRVYFIKRKLELARL